MHFAVGMGVAGLATTAICAIRSRGWRWLPLAMTLGGCWALVPDMPRLWREDFPSLPLAHLLGAKSLEKWLHSRGDLFFFHQRLDAQPNEYALHGLVLILLFYNLSLIGLWRENRRQQREIRSLARRWEAHAAVLKQSQGHRHPAR